MDVTSPDPEMVSCSSWGMWPASEDAEQGNKSRRAKALSGLAELDADLVGKPQAHDTIYQRLVASGALGGLD